MQGKKAITLSLKTCWMDIAVQSARKTFTSHLNPKRLRQETRISEYGTANNISQDVWSYQIGGYQVSDKWLKDRKDRVLSLDEIQTYCRIVTAIYKTIQIQKEIDKIYNEVEMSLNEA
jgi:hypothetical protein